MNNLIPINSPQTMSSREISDLTIKPHDNVLKLIRTLIAEGVVKNTIPQNYVHPQNKQTYVEFISDKRDSLVIVARLSPEFTAAVVDRWQELEAKFAAAQVPQTFAEALQLAANQAKQIELDAPKVVYYEKVVERDNLLNASQVAQKFKLSAYKLNKFLDKLDVYNHAVKRSRVFKQWFVDKGYGLVRQTPLGYPQAMFTLSGEAWVIEQLVSEGMV